MYTNGRFQSFSPHFEPAADDRRGQKVQLLGEGDWLALHLRGFASHLST